MTGIPYTTEMRPDTGLTNPKLGIWLFLASEVMLFGSFFSSYALLRTGALDWPMQSAVVSVPLATLNTIILISSSVTMVLAWTSLVARRLDRYRLYMGLTLLLGAAFLGVKAVEYGEKLAAGLVPATNNFLGLYFTMTGLHALHVVAGLVVNAYLIGPGVRMWRSDPARFTNRVEIAGIYWHFVDVVWIFLFPVLYLLQTGGPASTGARMEMIGAGLRTYLAVFGALLALTAMTVAISSLHLSGVPTVALGLTVATAKAALVALFFMHLKGEKPWVTWTLALTAVLFAALLGFVLWTEADHIVLTTTP